MLLFKNVVLPKGFQRTFSTPLELTQCAVSSSGVENVWRFKQKTLRLRIESFPKI